MYGCSSRKRREEYQSMVKDKVEEAEWKYFDGEMYLNSPGNLPGAAAPTLVIHKSSSHVDMHQ